MGYRVERLELEQAREQAASLEYALVYMLSDMQLGKTETVLDKILWGECTEARFFDATSEIHFFSREDGMQALRIMDIADELPVLEKAYSLVGNRRSVGEKLIVKEYMEFDDDGQAVVSLTRLAGIQ